jgi:hypothetical protein
MAVDLMVLLALTFVAMTIDWKSLITLLDNPPKAASK